MKWIPICLAAFLLRPAGSHAQAITIDQVSAAVRQARAGDTITIENGRYADKEILLQAEGDSLRPIVVRAATPGGVVLSGASSLRIAGRGIEVQGLHFTNGFNPQGAVIEFRNGKDLAYSCRVTQCAVDNYNPPARETESVWVLLYGRNNRFDHNSLSGKLNQGVTLIVILDGERNQQNNHRIEYNYFGARPVLGANGGETIRVGTSQSSMASSRTQIRNNFFEHCDGEVEIVSIKSCDNIIEHNTFYESSGVLALRHGHRNYVNGNAFIGNRKPNTGGIRVINEGHSIRNNYFNGLTGSRFFAALAVMNAVPNSLPNRYHQVKDVRIENNTWVNCDHVQFHVGKDNERTLAPENVVLEANTFYNPKSDTVFEALDKLDGFVFRNNRVITKRGRFAMPGFAEVKSGMPENRSGAVGRALCGASWHKPAAVPGRTRSGTTIKVKPGQNTLIDAVAKAGAGDIVELAAGTYLLDGPIVLRKYVRIQSAPSAAEKPVVRYNGSRSRVTLITIADKGLLELRGLAFDNDAFEEGAAAQAAIGPATAMSGHYSVWVEDCSFSNYTESSMSPFRAQRNTYADTILFSRCLFREMSGDAIYLSAEKDDAGKYSADYVEIRDCAFYKVLGHAVDLYRGGSDESTSGPSIVVDHCVLEDVNNKERGAGLRLLGVQTIVVRNTSFANTGRGGASIKLDETNWDKISISHCNLYRSGRVASFWGKAVKGPMFAVAPVYRDLKRFDFRLVKETTLAGKGTDGGAIGISN